MQQLDAITLYHLANEWQYWLAGSKISKIQHPSAYEFLITLWGGANRPDKLTSLYFYINPQLPFCTLVSNQHKKNALLHQFSQPTALCMLLRKHLHGATILSVSTLTAERVLNIVMTNENELGQRVQLLLTIEFMGKHSNLVLCQTSLDSNLLSTIVAVAHGVSEKMSRYRELAPGLPYIPPPVPAEKRLFTETTLQHFIALYAHKPETMSPVSFLNANFRGLGKQFTEILLQDCLPAAPEKEHHEEVVAWLNKIYQRLADALKPLPILLAESELEPETSLTEERLYPGVSLAGTSLEKTFATRGFSLISPEVSKNTRVWERFSSVNAMVTAYFVLTLAESRRQAEQKKLIHNIQQQENRLKQRLETVKPLSQELVADLQMRGDRLLLAVSAQEFATSAPKSGQTTVSLPHVETGEALNILVNPQYSWIENAQRYYRQVKKQKARNRNFLMMAETLKVELAYLKEIGQMAQQAETLPELAQLTEEWQGWQTRSLHQNPFSTEVLLPANTRSSGKLPKNRKKNSYKKGKQAAVKQIKQDTGIVTLTTSVGYPVLLGKSGVGNDALVGKLSRPNDLWLHVHDMPGAHVLLRTQASDPGFLNALEEAAMLAVYYSAGRNGVNVPVIYTESRFVRKIPGSYPGHVTYQKEKTVFITVNQNTLAILLASAV
jgi:predicted ribosome quality control (RQC) complex YloA/Tae2 family protein